jgi:hypothetical protein
MTERAQMKPRRVGALATAQEDDPPWPRQLTLSQKAVPRLDCDTSSFLCQDAAMV